MDERMDLEISLFFLIQGINRENSFIFFIHHFIFYLIFFLFFFILTDVLELRL